MTATSTERESRQLVRSLYVCYFLSGALGLVYEIVWLRNLLLIYGSTVHAVSTVLAIFFGGLALGSWLFGRLIDRRPDQGLRWYGFLEIGIGLYAFLLPWLFGLIRQLYIPIYRASDFSNTVLVVACSVFCALILIVPTTLLGGTFPCLSRYLIQRGEHRGTKLATLYAVNTAGATIGVLFVYLSGLPVLGLSRTVLFAGVLNIGIGVMCLIFDRHFLQLKTESDVSPKPSQKEELRMSRPSTPVSFRWLSIAFGISGVSAMIYEVAWTRALSLILGSSVYAFCVLLASFLGGMAFGSALARKDLARSPAQLAWVIRAEVLLCLFGILSLPLLMRMPSVFVTLWPLAGGSFAGLMSLQMVIGLLLMAVPTILLGFLFPVVSELATTQMGDFGKRLGGIYAINTVGGIIGSLVAGFMLIPHIGLAPTILAAALLNAIAAALLYTTASQSRRTVRMAMATAMVCLMMGFGSMILPFWEQELLAAGVYLDPQGYQQDRRHPLASNPTKLLYYRDGLNATVSVHQLNDNIFLKVGGKTDASLGSDMGTQTLSAHLPMMLHPNPERVLVIGLGSGITLGEASRYPLKVLHCAEIEPAVIEGARFFHAHNSDVHNHPLTRMFTVDGRNFLLATSHEYDVIISEPSNPWMAGVATLFTKEFYQLAKQRLAPGGVMCQWLQLYRIFPQDVKLILKTFHSEFPYVSVWTTTSGDLVLLGTESPQQFSDERVRNIMENPATRPGLQRVSTQRLELLQRLFLFDETVIETLTSDISWLHEDDILELEFNAPKALYADKMTLVNMDGIMKFKSSPEHIWPSYNPQAIAENAELSKMEAKIFTDRGELDVARKGWERAAELEPNNCETWLELGKVLMRERLPVGAEQAFQRAEACQPSDGRAAFFLGKLYWGQEQLPKAQQWFEQTLRLGISDAATAEETGRFFESQKQFELAAECYRVALSLVPQTPGPVLGRWFTSLAEADAWYRAAASQIPETPGPVLGRWFATLAQLRAWKELEDVSRIATAHYSQDGTLIQWYGRALYEQQRYPQAQEAFHRAIQFAPQHIEGYYGLAQCAARQGAWLRAVSLLHQGLRHDPYHRPSLELLDRLRGRST